MDLFSAGQIPDKRQPLLPAQPAPASPRRRSNGTALFSYAVVFAMLSSSMLVVNKGAMLLFPYPNTVLLAQLFTSALLARATGHADSWSYSRVMETLPVTGSFFLVVFTSMHALHQVNVDTMVVLKTCTPITVAVGEWMFLSTSLPSPRTWLSLSLVIILTAAAFSMHMAAISTANIIWLCLWLASITFYMVYSTHFVRTVKLTTMGRVYYENLLSGILCIPLVIAFDLPKMQLEDVTATWGPAGLVVGLSCVMGFAMSWLGWSLRQHITALSYTVLGVLNKLLTVVLNAAIWDKHGSPLSNALLVLGILMATLYQQQQQQQQQPGVSSKSDPGGKGGKSRHRSVKLVWSAVSTGAAVAVLVWLGTSLGGFLNSRAPTVHIKLDGQDLQQLGGATMHSLANMYHNHMQSTHPAAIIGAADSQDSSGTNISSTGGSGGSAVAVNAVGDSEYVARLREAASSPINVVIMSAIYWDIPPKATENCAVDGVPLDCQFTFNKSRANLDNADALYYHAPSFAGVPRPKAFPNQLRLVMSLESAAYYDDLDDPDYMCQFDAEMTYRSCSQVTNWYSLETFKKLFTTPLVPFEHKEHAIAYIQRNCNAMSGRSEIIRSLMKMGHKSKVPVHSMGACDRNKKWPGQLSKQAVFSKYKFCIAMENSVAHDYITEKVWDGLAAGCVPIYMGSASIRDYVPDRRGIIIYDPHGGGDASSPEELDALLHEIGSNKTRYEAMLAWKHRKAEEQPSSLFRHLWSLKGLSGECMLCQFLAMHRVNPKPRYTTCLFNSTWMAAAGQELQEDTCAAQEQQRVQQLLRQHEQRQQYYQQQHPQQQQTAII